MCSYKTLAATGITPKEIYSLKKVDRFSFRSEQDGQLWH
jgi:hypothetical protein